MLTTRRLCVVTTTMLLYACGGSKSEPTAPQPTPSVAQTHGGTASAGGVCPMDVSGTKVAVDDTADGVAIRFTTTGDVAQLRQRVHAMADKHEHMMHGGMMGSGGMGPGHGGGPGHMMKMVDSTARAEDIEGGARIVLTPKDPAQLGDLRAHVREHAARMASGHCPMMEQQG